MKNMDPKTVAYLLRILIPIGITIGRWTVSSLKHAIREIKVKKEVKEMLDNIDIDYEELCKTLNRH
jgi:hypothetical protein